MFQPSPADTALYKRLEDFMQIYIFPLEEKYFQAPFINHPEWGKWEIDPHIELLKAKAKSERLWNLFLPSLSGLNNLAYASFAELMGIA